MKNVRPLVAAAVGLTSMLLASSAFAQTGGDEEVTAKPISASLLVGFGTNDLNFGVGVRGGYTLPMKVYLGATFMYHFGTSSSTPLGDVSASFFYPGIEGGYEIHAGPVWVRPYLGLGVGISHVSTPSGTIAGVSYGGSASSSDFAIWPGAVVTYNINDQFFVGGDARILFVDGHNSFNIFANGGMRF